MHILVDTNVILESHRTKCWNALTGRYGIDTVWRCVEECETGNQSTYNPIYVDTKELQKKIKPKSISDRDVANLILRYQSAVDLVPGEKELLAYAVKIEQESFLLCSPDKACMRAAYNLGWIDQYIALEHLTKNLGLKVSLRNNFTKKWMDIFKTRLLLELE